jgi:hypothetical protein
MTVEVDSPRPRTAPSGQGCGPDAAPSATDLFLDNLGYAGMIALGAALTWGALRAWPWAWIAVAAYVAYGVLGALWVILFICPYCARYGVTCPCGYGRIAAALRKQGDRSLFRRKFWRHIPVIVPLWFAPLVPAGLTLTAGLDPVVVALAVAFVLEGCVLLPLVSKRRSCSTCTQKSQCPWMKQEGECKEP